MQTIIIQIISAPIACKDGMKETWHEITEWAGAQLCQRFGEGVQVQYFDLFDPACPPMPVNAQLPLVLVNREVLSSGGKISVPAIRRKIEAILDIEKP